MTLRRIPEPTERTYDTLARIRDAGAVVPVEFYGVAMYAVTTYAAVREVLSNDEVYARHTRNWPALRDGTVPADWPLRALAEGDHMAAQDGLDHRRMRNMVNKAFTPARVAALAPRIEEIATSLIDDLAHAGDGVDLIPAFGEALPIKVICELFGIPEEDREAIRAWTRSIVGSGPEAIEAVNEMIGYLAGFAERRRGDLRDDLTSMLIKVQDGGEVTLSDEELAGLLFLFLFAGHENTMHLIDNAVVALSLYPDQRDLAIRDGLWDQVVEETLRRYPSAPMTAFRYTTQDTTLAGVDLPAGVALLPFVFGADSPEHGTTADQFDITRPQKGHLTFGYGPHFCIGAPLARIEGRIGLAALYRRFPNLRAAVAPADLMYAPGITVGPASLPVHLK